MWVKWNGRKIVAGPQSEPPWITENLVRKPPPGWYPLDDSAERSSPSQEQVIKLEGGTVVIQYGGDPDPDNALVELPRLKQARDLILELPLTIGLGTFQFDSMSRAKMDRACLALSIRGGTVEWRLLDNSVVVCDLEQLEQVRLTLEEQAALREMDVDQEYMIHRGAGITEGELREWMAQYKAV